MPLCSRTPVSGYSVRRRPLAGPVPRACAGAGCGGGGARGGAPPPANPRGGRPPPNRTPPAGGGGRGAAPAPRGAPRPSTQIGGESPGSQRYIGPKFWQARKSAPSGDSVPNSDQALGRKTRSSGTLCMLTGMRSMDARVISWPPMWP